MAGKQTVSERQLSDTGVNPGCSGLNLLHNVLGRLGWIGSVEYGSTDHEVSGSSGDGVRGCDHSRLVAGG